MGAEESASRVGQVLEDLDKKLDGGEDLCVGPEGGVVGSALDDGVSASFVHEELLQGDGRANASRRVDLSQQLLGGEPELPGLYLGLTCETKH